jgi:hypothetical protein
LLFCCSSVALPAPLLLCVDFFSLLPGPCHGLRKQAEKSTGPPSSSPSAAVW